jgi:peptidoglycan-associated lipoprotein
MKQLHLSFAFALALGVVACADKKPPETPKTDDVAVEKNDAPAKTDRDDDSLTARGDIDDKIAKMCDLPEAHFSFNSAALSGQAKGVLDKLAECFKTGAGKGKNMNITGHADPRGDNDTNFALGQRRAGAVAVYLKTVGLGEDRVATGSRGELDATGTDEASWAKDRRVEILLAQ